MIKIARQWVPHIGEICADVPFPYSLLYHFSNGLTAGPIGTHDSSNNAVWLKKVPFQGADIFTKLCLEGLKSPKPSILLKFPFSSKSNNFE